MSAKLIHGLSFHSRGKGKDLYKIPGHPDLLLLVFRDSVSTHNIVHISEPRGKGKLIAAQTLFMHLMVLDGIPNHIEEFGRDIYRVLPEGDYEEDLHHRAFVVRRMRGPDTEFIYRAYLAGSLAKVLKEDGTDPYGHNLTSSLPCMYRFPEPIFTPTEKSKTDLPLRASAVSHRYPNETQMALSAFTQAQRYLYLRDIELIDAKFELVDGILVDDWLNGDCARLARRADIREGVEPPFLDKEIFRQIAIRRWAGGERVPLAFTDEEIEEGLHGYHRGFELVTGMNVLQFQQIHLDI